MAQPPTQCNHCGAPREPGLAACRYCRTPFVSNVHRDAVPCPSCGVLNEKGAQKCAMCSAWVVVQCVFCSALSPHNHPACDRCREPFAGAPERMQQRRQEQEMQQRMQMVSSVGGVAVSLLGAVASSGLLSSSDDDCDDCDEDEDER